MQLSPGTLIVINVYWCDRVSPSNKDHNYVID